MENRANARLGQKIPRGLRAGKQPSLLQALQEAFFQPKHLRQPPIREKAPEKREGLQQDDELRRGQKPGDNNRREREHKHRGPRHHRAAEEGPGLPGVPGLAVQGAAGRDLRGDLEPDQEEADALLRGDAAGALSEQVQRQRLRV